LAAAVRKNNNNIGREKVPRQSPQPHPIGDALSRPGSDAVDGLFVVAVADWPHQPVLGLNWKQRNKWSDVKLVLFLSLLIGDAVNTTAGANFAVGLAKFCSVAVWSIRGRTNWDGLCGRFGSSAGIICCCFILASSSSFGCCCAAAVPPIVWTTIGGETGAEDGVDVWWGRMGTAADGICGAAFA
jgi:hypothetical protein